MMLNKPLSWKKSCHLILWLPTITTNPHQSHQSPASKNFGAEWNSCWQQELVGPKRRHAPPRLSSGRVRWEPSAKGNQAVRPLWFSSWCGTTIYVFFSTETIQLTVNHTGLMQHCSYISWITRASWRTPSWISFCTSWFMDCWCINDTGAIDLEDDQLRVTIIATGEW